MGKIKILNIIVDNFDLTEAINAIDEIVGSGKRGRYVVTPNVDHIVKLEGDKELREVYSNADLVLTDGMPIIWVSKLYNTPIKMKVSGSDLFPEMCEMAANKGYTMFFLGGGEGVAEKAAENLRKKYSGLKIIGTYSPPYSFENDKQEIEKIVNMINKFSPNILVVGLGCPKQEKFIYKYRNRLNVNIFLGLGATLDFEAGRMKRAPSWMSNCGLEWFYRLMKEPKRMFYRYIIEDSKFFILIFKYWKKNEDLY